MMADTCAALIGAPGAKRHDDGGHFMGNPAAFQGRGRIKPTWGSQIGSHCRSAIPPLNRCR